MNVASFIEHTNLSPQLVIGDVDRLVEEGILFGFAGVCLPPFWVRRAWRERGQHSLQIVTVAGFPFGYNMTETKLDEISRAIDNGADEIDVVWNISAFRTGIPWTKIDIAKCGKVAHDHQRILKVIIETAYLSDAQIESACRICADAGADYVKTSTGYAPGGATPENIALMKKVLPSSVGIKASGGIKTLQQAQSMIAAGADRIGTSSAVSIVSSQQHLQQP
jgi:deoxyribose-phosphate aldolase